MLKTKLPPQADRRLTVDEDDEANILQLATSFFLGHAKLISGCIFVGILAAVLYVVTAQPTYTASSTLLIDESRVDVFQRPSVVSDPITDSAFVESQIEVLRSDIVARQVVRTMNLTEVEQPKPGLFVGLAQSVRNAIGKARDTLKTIVGLSEPAPVTGDSADDKEALAAADVRDSVTVRRVGVTFVVSISATRHSPAEARDMADAMAEAFIAVDQAAKQANTKRAIVWLEERLKELRQKSADADQAVDAFKRNQSNAVTDRALVSSQLRQLESIALSYRNLYDNLQTRFVQAVLEESFIASKARIISRATLPTGRSSPRTILALLAGALAGFLGGVGLGLVRESLREGIRTANDLERATSVDCLAVLEDLRVTTPLLERITIGRGKLRRSLRQARFAVEKPLNHFSQELRRLSLNLRNRRGAADKALVVGMISLYPDEGKSTVASNLAQTLGMSGQPTLLLDLDLRNPSLTRIYNPPLNIPDLFDPPSRLDELWRDPRGHIDFLTASRHREVINDRRIFASKNVEDRFAKLRKRYEFIVIDLPPLRAMADADALKHVIDLFILVAEPGRARHGQLAEVLNRFDPAREQLFAAVLNKAHVPDVHGYYKYGQG